MQKIDDIRKYKNQLRTKYKNLRTNMDHTEKIRLDEMIFSKVVSLPNYNRAKTILTFVSTDIEVDTKRLISHALSDGKKVAVPKCISGTRRMEFYYINSFDDLEVATFSVLEPKVDVCEKLIDFNDSICIVPGLIFDLSGYRLGYGKGYYDRFLANYSGVNIGVCYSSCMVSNLIHSRFDKKVDLVITDKYVKTVR